MISLVSYLLTFLGVIFWAFRVYVTLMFQLGQTCFATPINANAEILVLFATIPCLIFVIKRNIVGAACYLAVYATYFGTALYETFVNSQAVGLDISNGANLLLTLAGIIIPLLTFIDILVNRNRNLGGGNKKADWFYNNSDYDREYDERADRNQYKF